MPLRRSSVITGRSNLLLGGAATRSVGLGAVAIIAAVHGSAPLVVMTYGAGLTWVIGMIFGWRLRWRLSMLLDDIARQAMKNPGDEDLRTLLVDVSSTHLDELGTRLPTRPRLKHIQTNRSPAPRCGSTRSGRPRRSPPRQNDHGGRGG